MAFKPIDPKRDEFRRYLERAGVVEALTKVFVRIVKERPENPIEYLRHNLGDSLQQADNMAYLQSELEESRVEIQRLRDIIESVHPEALEEEQQSPQANESSETPVEDLSLGENGVVGSSDLEAEAALPPPSYNSEALTQAASSEDNDVQQPAKFANEDALNQAN